MSVLDAIGGEEVFRAIAWVLLIEAFLIAVLQAGNMAHTPTREAIIGFWVAFLLIACRIVIRGQLGAPRYSWWGNGCWLILVLAAARLLFEHWSGRAGWPTRDDDGIWNGDERSFHRPIRRSTDSVGKETDDADSR